MPGQSEIWERIWGTISSQYSGNPSILLWFCISGITCMSFWFLEWPHLCFSWTTRQRNSSGLSQYRERSTLKELYFLNSSEHKSWGGSDALGSISLENQRRKAEYWAWSAETYPLPASPSPRHVPTLVAKVTGNKEVVVCFCLRTKRQKMDKKGYFW